MKRAQKAFTLVELLVVVSIIALLLAILMPALSKVKEQGRIILCGANLKNYGPALYMYAQTNNDKAPFSFSWLYKMSTIKAGLAGKGSVPQGCRWHYDKDTPDGTLWPYLKDKNVHMCPTFKMIIMTERKGVCGNEGSPASQGWPVDYAHSSNTPFNPMYSYSMNRRIGMDWEGFIADPTLSQEPSLKMSRVNRPALCFAFAEENPSWKIDVPPDGREDLLHHFYRKGDTGAYSGASMGKNDLWMYANKGQQNSPISNFATYHGVGSNRRDEGKANVLFVDSHIKLTRGLPGYAAYLEYARPYWGQELLNIW